jgi:hypothetical protein
MSAKVQLEVVSSTLYAFTEGLFLLERLAPRPRLSWGSPGRLAGGPVLRTYGVDSIVATTVDSHTLAHQDLGLGFCRQRCW